MVEDVWESRPPRRAAVRAEQNTAAASKRDRVRPAARSAASVDDVHITEAWYDQRCWWVHRLASTLV